MKKGEHGGFIFNTTLIKVFGKGIKLIAKAASWFEKTGWKFKDAFKKVTPEYKQEDKNFNVQAFLKEIGANVQAFPE